MYIHFNNKTMKLLEFIDEVYRNFKHPDARRFLWSLRDVFKRMPFRLKK